MSTATNDDLVIRDLERWAEVTGQELGQAVGSAALKVIDLTITRTPVDEGRLRGNWQTTTGSPATGVINRIDKDGRLALAEATQVVSSFVEGEIWFANNLPYAKVVEFGLYPGGSTEKTSNGFSRLAPAGMLRVSVGEFNSALRAAIRRANNS